MGQRRTLAQTTTDNEQNAKHEQTNNCKATQMRNGTGTMSGADSDTPRDQQGPPGQHREQPTQLPSQKATATATTTKAT